MTAQTTNFGIAARFDGHQRHRAWAKIAGRHLDAAIPGTGWWELTIAAVNMGRTPGRKPSASNGWVYFNG
jgi:hypothetical protein